jgi:hypothetical protein
VEAVVMAKPKKLSPWTFLVELPPDIPDLSQQEKAQLGALIKLSRAQRIEVERTRKDFCRSLRISRQSPEHSQILMRSKRTASALSALVSALTNGQPRKAPTFNTPFDGIGILLWSRLINAHNSPSTLPSLMILEERAYSIVEEVKPRAQVDSFRRIWNFFVDRLASVYERNVGIKPTSAKSSRAKSPKLSPFAQIVWSVMETLPMDCRVHMHSPQAMAKAVAEALAARRSSQKSAGPISSRD